MGKCEKIHFQFDTLICRLVIHNIYHAAHPWLGFVFREAARLTIILKYRKQYLDQLSSQQFAEILESEGLPRFWHTVPFWNWKILKRDYLYCWFHEDAVVITFLQF